MSARHPIGFGRALLMALLLSALCWALIASAVYVAAPLVAGQVQDTALNKARR